MTGCDRRIHERLAPDSCRWDPPLHIYRIHDCYVEREYDHDRPGYVLLLIIAGTQVILTLLCKDWYSIPPGATLDNEGVAYAVGKTEGEKAIWAYGEAHPELDITVCKYPSTLITTTRFSPHHQSIRA